MGVLADSVALWALQSGARRMGLIWPQRFAPFRTWLIPELPSRARSAPPARAARVPKSPTERAEGGSLERDVQRQ